MLGVTNPQPMLIAGDRAIQANNWQEASIHFNNAIDTRQLNSAGMAVAYWNIHIAESNLHHIDKDMEALLGFIVYGYDFAEAPWPSFKRWRNEFRLERKLNHAFALMQANWANHNSYSCRSKLFACYIKTKSLIEIFERAVPFCKNRTVQSIKISDKKKIMQTNVACSDNSIETYYFVNQ